ncbi:MAG: hypothetical protein GY906_13005 [bacterium]|nr:hypothetical protein [bacterium]
MRAILAPSTLDELKDMVVAFMISAGWANDGAPTETILVGAADTEGRKPYMRFYTHVGDGALEIDIGDSRSGDTVEINGGSVAVNGSRIYFNEEYYQIVASDRWLFIEELYAGENALMQGMVESPYNLATHTSPLFLYRNYTPGSATFTNCQLGTYGTTSGLWVPHPAATPTTFHAANSTVLRFMSSTSVVQTPYQQRQFVRAQGTSGPSHMAHNWWILPYDEYLYGYIKDTKMVYGLGGNANDYARGEVVQIGSHMYYRGSYDNNNGMLVSMGSSGIAFHVMLKGELISG